MRAGSGATSGCLLSASLRITSSPRGRGGLPNLANWQNLVSQLECGPRLAVGGPRGLSQIRRVARLAKPVGDRPLGYGSLRIVRKFRTILLRAVTSRVLRVHRPGVRGAEPPRTVVVII